MKKEGGGIIEARAAEGGGPYKDAPVSSLPIGSQSAWLACRVNKPVLRVLTLDVGAGALAGPRLHGAS